MLSRFVQRTVRATPLAATQQLRRFADGGQTGLAGTFGSRRLDLSPNAGVLTTRPDVTVQSCAEMMAMAKVGSFVVIDNARRCIGIVTERDVLRCVGSSWDRLVKGKGMNVQDIMTPSNKLIVCSVFDSRSKILQTMHSNQIRHVLLMDASQVTECISLRDLVKDLINSDQLDKVMNSAMV